MFYLKKSSFVFHFNSVCNTSLSPAQQAPLFAWKVILISSITVFWLSVQCVYNTWYWLQCAVYTSPFLHPCCPRYIQFFFWKCLTDMKRKSWIELWRKQIIHWRHVPSLGAHATKTKNTEVRSLCKTQQFLLEVAVTMLPKERGSSGSIVLWTILIFVQGISASQFNTVL